MKNKSARHKEFNTFKFVPFIERIENVDIDVFHSFGHEYETPNENQSYFYQTIEKWNVLNLTEGFNAFKRDVNYHNFITLPQVILQKEFIVKTLLKHLKLKDPLCLQPLLEITASVVKDLRKEFYEYYPEFLEVLIEILNTKDPEQLEWTFTCLAFLFKFLWRPLIKDIGTVFGTLLPLLSENKPEFISNFAAQSFGFVARKVKDNRLFLRVVLKAVKTHKDGISGCAKLFYEVIRGVNGNFHSCAENFLQFLLESLRESSSTQTVLYEILEKLVPLIVYNIKVHKCETLWSVLINALDKSLLEKNPQNVDYSLKLLGESVECLRGKIIQDPSSIIKKLADVFKCTDLPETVLITASQVAIILLLTDNVKLSQEHTSLIIQNLLLVPHKKVLLYFIDNVSSFSLFEPFILPKFLDICANSFDEATFDVLAKLILKKSPLSESGINLTKWSRYAIDFKQNSTRICETLLDYCGLNFNGNWDDYVRAVICIPHLNITPNMVGKVYEKLRENVALLCEKNAQSEGSFLINISVECLVHLKKRNGCVELFNELFPKLLGFCKRESDLWALKTLDLLLTALSDSDCVINTNNLETIHEVLETNFSSSAREVRLLTCHIYSLFEKLEEFNGETFWDPETPQEEFKVFSICYAVESIDPQVNTYRTQLQNLEKFQFSKPQITMCIKTKFKCVPLRYLCGALYINFKLLWEPILNIIESHAHGLDCNTFWGVFGAELKKVATLIRSDSTLPQAPNCYDLLEKFTEKPVVSGTNPDFCNYRLLLWKGMSGFPDVAERNTRDISELFLQFIDFEYKNSNSEMALTWDVKQHQIEDETEENEAEETEKSSKRSGKLKMKTLIEKLQLFSKIRSPLSMYKEPELRNSYLDFLLHKNCEVQKAALNCLLTYKFKYLTPYKENLYNLINDKTFKNELTTFKIDEQSTAISPEYRFDLIPIIMRVLFSKMTAKTGLRTGGKSSGQNRRNLIFRFLAGCKENEMFEFVKMAFKYYTKYTEQTNPETAVNKLELNKFFPPKRLLSTVNLLNIVMEHFGGLMGNDLLNYLLKVIFVIGAAAKTVFKRINQVHAGYFNIFRQIRTSSIELVEKFFQKFDAFLWETQQIDTVFSLFVWPYLEKLNSEGIHSPTTLLKLFSQWASNPKYFRLLIKQNDTNESEQNILPQVMKLLVNEKTNNSVAVFIEEMIVNLLRLEESEEDLKAVLPVQNLLEIKRTGTQNINFGSRILLQHVPLILNKIKNKLEANKSKRGLNKRELFILSRISEFITERDVSLAMLNLLIPVVLFNKTSDEEILAQFLGTIKNLVQNVPREKTVLKKIAPLFGEVAFVSGRKILCEVLKIIASDDAYFELIADLNSYDSKWVDQPDFAKRHAAFKKIQQLVEQNALNFAPDCGVLFVYNFYFFVKYEKDLSLRENSSHYLKHVCRFLLLDHQKNKELSDSIFSLIRKGLSVKTTPDFRNECISLLGYLARECPDSNAILDDLNKFTNKTDLEVDVFENLVHLQLHRHARGLIKIAEVLRRTETAPSVRTLTQFVLPLASYYLCSEKYTGKNSILDAAVDLTGAVCRVLPWHNYEGLLKFYLRKLQSKHEFQKQLVKLVIIILEAFHFDLSKSDFKAGEKLELEVLQDAAESMASEKTEDLVEVDELSAEYAAESAEGEPDDEEGEEEISGLKACEKTSVLCKSTANRVVNTIQNVLLPQLRRTLGELTNFENAHKVNRKKLGFEREEEDLIKVPISLALVKLLQRLPEGILDRNLPQIFLKLCTFLKSRLDSVRKTARETLQKIMLTLGPKYLKVFLSEVAPLLSKGYQAHVLVFTVHGVLNCLKNSYSPRDIDEVLVYVINLCKTDLFGILSEEKEVHKIAVKVSEAKSTKSYEILHILAEHITDKCLVDLILPIKEILHTTQSFKKVNKAQEALRHITLGLVDNKFIGTQSLITYAYGLSSESIPELREKEKLALSEKEREKLQRRRSDCFIITANVCKTAPRQKSAKVFTKTNSHLLVEFGLHLCYFMLKRDLLREESLKPYVDPFVGIFRECLQSKHVKLQTYTLQCLNWVCKYDLPSMRTHVEEIVGAIFKILHKYTSVGLKKGDNFDLVVAAFKVMSVVVREVTYYTVTVEQLKALLLYVEQDIHDSDRQATAFNLLKAIIARKLIVSEIHEVMEKVAEMSVTSELKHIRSNARLVFFQYLMDYPLKNKLDKHVSFYLSQMDFEMQYGRESAIEMVQTLVQSFPYQKLKEFSSTFFLTLGTRLVNEEVPECKKMVNDCLVAMLTRLFKQERDELFEVILVWLKDKKINHRRLGAQLCGILVVVEKSAFESRLPQIGPLTLQLLKLTDDNKKKNHSEENERVKDHYLFQVLQLVLKISAHCPLFLKHSKQSENLAIQVQCLLSYPHEWVRLGAAQFIGFVLATLDANKLALNIINSNSEEGYLYNNPSQTVKALTLDLCDQLRPGTINSELAEQVIKNLIFVARVLEKLPASKGDKNNNALNLLWLVKLVRKIVNTEVVETPKVTILRTEIFKWIAAITTTLDLGSVKLILHHLLAPLVREMVTTEESNAPLRQLAKEVGTVIKRAVGLEVYSENLASLQSKLSVKRAERKRANAQIAVTDPELYAKKKIKAHEKKKIAKKRKVSVSKGGVKKNFKKRKTVDLEAID